MVLLLVSCWLRGGEARDPVDAGLGRADAVFAERGELDRLDEAIELYRGLLAEHPQDPRVLHALAVAWTARAWGHPSEAQAAEYERARAYGLRCLERNPGFSSRVELGAGRVTEGAVRQLSDSDADCLDATLVAWVRWVELRGPAAAIDLEPLRHMARKSRLLQPGWVGPWGEAMSIVLLEGPLDRDLLRSRAMFQNAIKAEPRLAVAHLDFARHQLLLEGERSAFERELRSFDESHPPESDGPWALENEAARVRAAELYDETGAAWDARW